jgi:magnesium chelatase family protein
MLARVFSACLAGVDAALVRVEVDVSQGLPAFATVGLPDPAVRESRERVRTAIRNSGVAFPLERVTVNLPGPTRGRKGRASTSRGSFGPRASRASSRAPGSSRLPPARRRRSPCRAIGYPSGRGSCC